MTTSSAALRGQFTSALFSIFIAASAVSIAGCGAADDEAPAGSATQATTASANGVTLKGDGLMLDARTSPAMLRGHSGQPLSVRIMGGWLDKDKAKRANQETDEAEKKKLAMASFGLLTLQVAAGTAEPGTYQLAAEEGGPQSGTVTIDKAKSAGLAADYTSQSGTLTIKSVATDAGSAMRSVNAIEGTFDGQFASDDGDRRAFSGSFRFVPKK